MAKKLKVVAFGKPKQKKRNIRNITVRMIKAREGIKNIFLNQSWYLGNYLEIRTYIKVDDW